MKKISTLFKKDPNDLGRVINEVNPENQWVFDGEGIPTRKFDGTACAIIGSKPIIGGKLYKRYDVKKGKTVPSGAIPCQEPDEITGHWPHWIPCDRNNPADQYHFEALDSEKPLPEGTYELCGPRINKNPERFGSHLLIPHGEHKLLTLTDFSFENIRAYLTKNDIEGIVFHHVSDGRMCKIRKSDFGLKRNVV